MDQPGKRNNGTERGATVMRPEQASGEPSRFEQDPSRPEDFGYEKHPGRQITPEQAQRLGRVPVMRTTRDGSRQLAPEQTRALGRRAVQPDRVEADRDRRK